MNRRRPLITCISGRTPMQIRLTSPQIPHCGSMKMTTPMQKLALIVMPIMSAALCGEAQSSDPAAVSTRAAAITDSELANGLVGHWKLQGDCRDYSGKGNHGVNHGVKLEDGTFDGVSGYIEVPNHPSLDLGSGDFANSPTFALTSEPWPMDWISSWTSCTSGSPCQNSWLGSGLLLQTVSPNASSG